MGRAEIPSTRQNKRLWEICFFLSLTLLLPQEILHLSPPSQGQACGLTGKTDTDGQPQAWKAAPAWSQSVTRTWLQQVPQTQMDTILKQGFLPPWDQNCDTNFLLLTKIFHHQCNSGALLLLLKYCRLDAAQPKWWKEIRKISLMWFVS